ncbi:MAG: ribose-phosphate pyrophosphokinase [Alphaproteobacteria bacterium]|nr:ribose-phosphate pyrophosphokinase [Alphaproteobacteria bacterium]
MHGEITLFSGNSNRALAQRICQRLGHNLAACRVGRFSDGEIRVEVDANVRGRDVFLIQSTCAPANDHLMEVLIMAEACKRASAGRITAVIPYFGYARQDRKVAPRQPITARLVANLIQAAGLDRVLTMDLHAGQIQGFFDIPVDNLYAQPMFFQFLREEIVTGDPGSYVMVSPDAGGVERVRSYARRLHTNLAIIDKRRSGPNQAEVMHIIGDVAGKTAILLDDMIDTAGTLTNAAHAVANAGAEKVYAVATHPVFSGPAVTRMAESPFDRIFVTDTIPLTPEAAALEGMYVLNTAPIFADAIRAIHFDDSISRLFLPD